MEVDGTTGLVLGNPFGPYHPRNHDHSGTVSIGLPGYHEEDRDVNDACHCHYSAAPKIDFNHSDQFLLDTNCLDTRSHKDGVPSLER